MFCLSTALVVAGICSIADLNRELAKKFERAQAFCVTATVVSVSNSSKPARYASDRQRQFYVHDGRRYSLISQLQEKDCALTPGDRVRFDGRLTRERYGWSTSTPVSVSPTARKRRQRFSANI